MPKIDLAAVPEFKGSSYPPPHNEPCMERSARRLAPFAGLTQFGVNIVTLPPGAWASQRHWHTDEDEFAMVLDGELVLVEDEGETRLRAGDCAAWKAGVENGHHLVNRSQQAARCLVVGSRSDEDRCDYPDIDMKLVPGRYSGKAGFTRRDGSAY